MLRFAVPTDRGEYVSLRRGSRDALERWEPVPPPGIDAFGPSDFDRLLATSDTLDCKRLLVIHRESGAIAGRVGLSGIARGPLQQAYLGYWLGCSFEGRGLMQEAIALALRYAFTPETQGGLGLHRVECNVMPSNTRSLATARRAGFREEGFSPKYLQIAGVWEDHVRFAMTIEDWAQKHP
ncbi:MAG TPA: GNAT family protein [Phycisphaerales bacterium]|nr:GNAT family protein [Phycisphaerales bacterium]